MVNCDLGGRQILIAVVLDVFIWLFVASAVIIVDVLVVVLGLLLLSLSLLCVVPRNPAYLSKHI